MKKELEPVPQKEKEVDLTLAQKNKYLEERFERFMMDIGGALNHYSNEILAVQAMGESEFLTALAEVKAKRKEAEEKASEAETKE